jgi:hypothetical protein
VLPYRCANFNQNFRTKFSKNVGQSWTTVFRLPPLAPPICELNESFLQLKCEMACLLAQFKFRYNRIIDGRDIEGQSLNFHPTTARKRLDFRRPKLYGEQDSTQSSVGPNRIKFAPQTNRRQQPARKRVQPNCHLKNINVIEKMTLRHTRILGGEILSIGDR